MLRIKLHGMSARWDDDAFAFVSKDAATAQALNSALDREELARVDAPFLQGGVQGLALKQVRAVYGNGIAVVRQTAPPVPPDRPGVTYKC